MCSMSLSLPQAGALASARRSDPGSSAEEARPAPATPAAKLEATPAPVKQAAAPKAKPVGAKPKAAGAKTKEPANRNRPTK